MKHGRSLASLIVLAGLVLPFAGGPANAQTISQNETKGATAARHSAGNRAPFAQASVTASKPTGTRQAADVITCTPQVQNPHNSSHVNGTVNVVVTLKCTETVTRIAIRAALYRNGDLVKDSGSKNVYGSASAQNNAAVSCSNANYQGWMSYVVDFPAGYTPPSGSGSGFGNAVSITC